MIGCCCTAGAAWQQQLHARKHVQQAVTGQHRAGHGSAVCCHQRKRGGHQRCTLQDIVRDLPEHKLPVGAPASDNVVLLGVEVERHDLVGALEDHVRVDEVPEAPHKDVVCRRPPKRSHALSECCTACQRQRHHALHRSMHAVGLHPLQRLRHHLEPHISRARCCKVLSELGCNGSVTGAQRAGSWTKSWGASALRRCAMH
jgi:hypothetical protein